MPVGDEERVKRHARAALGVCALMLTGGLHAAGLFLPVDPAETTDAAPAAKPKPTRQNASAVPDAWERRVRVARHALAAARADVENTGVGHLLLNVRDGVRLNAVVERTASTKRGYSLSGRVADGGADGGTGFVTLVVREDVVAGSFWTPRSSYELLPVGGGVHALRDVTKPPPMACGGMPRAELDVAPDGGAPDVDDVSVVDILVVYTPLAEEGAANLIAERGGSTASPDVARSWIEASTHLAVAWTNDAFERSGAFVSLNLVGLVGLGKVDSEAETFDHGVNILRSDEVRALRDRFGADLVHAIIRCRSCGGAYFRDGLCQRHYWTECLRA